MKFSKNTICIGVHKVTNKLFKSANINLYSRFYNPAQVSIDITNKCCLRCVHCDFWKNTKSHDMTTEKIMESLSRMKKFLGCYHLTITGGEPLLRDDVCEIISCAKQLGLSATLITNGFFMDEEQTKNIVGSGLDKLIVSLDSHIPDVHDETRGRRGCFERAVAGLRNIRSFKHNTGVYVQTILMKTNLSSVEEMLIFFESLGVDGIILQALWKNLNYSLESAPDWRAKSLLWPTIEESEKALDTIIRLKTRGVPIHNSFKQLSAIQSYYASPDKFNGMFSCDTGETVKIDSSGNMRLCYAMEPFATIDDADIGDAWKGILRKDITQRINSCNMGCKALNCNYMYSTYDLILNLIEEIRYS
ncbi:MAG: radical SAM protein [Candidatus Altiarchaeota archaeon]|nr:radical SAM protein [Candidatus Altiarchaeota archaeon]